MQQFFALQKVFFLFFHSDISCENRPVWEPVCSIGRTPLLEILSIFYSLAYLFLALKISKK
jgi:hypothetical protein